MAVAEEGGPSLPGVGGNPQGDQNNPSDVPLG